MILIIGGAHSGKRDYARSLGYSESEISQNVWELLHAGENADSLLETLCEMPVVICDEVGSGIVPVDREDREAREACGRLCIELAKRANSVIRMVCGIATVLKQES